MNATSRSLASPLANRTYRHLYLAQISALTGTGVMNVGLALLACQLAGENAGSVLGIALRLRIVAFVLISPLFGAYAHLLPRRQVLVAPAFEQHPAATSEQAGKTSHRSLARRCLRDRRFRR